VYFISFFFFSSRRRHTRWPRDWSSDVCSSDLVFAREERTRLDGGVSQGHLRQRARWKGTPAPMKGSIKSLLGRIVFESRLTAIRSEERRVGKECRSRWWRYQ